MKKALAFFSTNDAFSLLSYSGKLQFTIGRSNKFKRCTLE